MVTDAGDIARTISYLGTLKIIDHEMRMAQGIADHPAFRQHGIEILYPDIERFRVEQKLLGVAAGIELLADQAGINENIVNLALDFIDVNQHGPASS